MKKISLNVAPGDEKDSHLRIRMGPKGGAIPTHEILIPFTLMFTDMFHRGVLAPMDERLFFTKDDDRALIAYHYINSATANEAPDHASIQQIIPANLVLASVAYKELAGLTDTFIDNVLLEMEDEEPDLDKHIFFAELIDKCVPKVNAFMIDPLSRLSDESKTELYLSILKPYAVFAENAADRKPKVTYHPEVLNGDGLAP